MGLYEPKNCCFCFDTKNGSLILAALSLIGSLLCIVLAVSGILAFCIEVALDPLVKSHALDDNHRRNIIAYVCIAVIAWNTLVGICSCLLIHGIRKDRPGLMLPYLVLHRFVIVISIVLIVILVGLPIAIAITVGTSSVFNSQHQYFYIQSVVLTIFVIMSTISKIYFHLVMNAYHKKVKRALSQDHSILCEEFDNDGTDDKVKV